MVSFQTKTPIRYPGGKQRFLPQIIKHLPRGNEIEGLFIEPFLGGGAVFLAVQAKPAVLNDKNHELIELYKGIRRAPHIVWQKYSAYKGGKREYYRVRHQDTTGWDVISKAARTLYLNRTCFKGMWRQNSQGRFNVGYGGQARRWAITEEDLVQVAKALKGVKLLCSDFEAVVDSAQKKDFLFLDPPYHPGRRESRVEHYMFSQFTFSCHERLAASLDRATKRGVRWAMTTSSHADIQALYSRYVRIPFEAGVGHTPGRITKETGEIIVLNE
jgi:DNA adenine methylase